MADRELPERSRLVAEALSQAGVTPRIQVLDAPAKTAVAAAELVGCEVGAIANSLIFTAVSPDGSTGPVLILTSGAHRVDQARTAERIGAAELQRATPEVVREATGQAIGGVAPVGHPAPVPTWVDESLAEFEQLWAAGGTPNTLFPISYPDLLRLVGGATVQVT